MTIKKPNKFIELIKNTLHIYSAKTCKDGSIVFCDYLKTGYKTGHQYGNDVKVEYEEPYVNGEIHGIVKHYYENGQLLCEEPYVRNKKQDISKAYYITGELLAETPFVDNKEHGIEKVYYENGQVKEETSYENGKMNGIFVKRIMKMAN